MKQMNPKDFKFKMPPVIGQDTGLPPTDLDSEPPRKYQCCANCNAFAIVTGPPFGQTTVCCADPPKPILLYIVPGKVVDPVTGKVPQYPVTGGFQSPTEPERWCRRWEWAGPGDDK